MKFRINHIAFAFFCFIVLLNVALIVNKFTENKKEKARHESLFEGPVPLELYADSTGDFMLTNAEGDSVRYSTTYWSK